MKLTRKLLAAMLSVCMVLALLIPAASAADLQANYSTASYYDIAVSTYSRMLMFQDGVVPAANASKQYGLIDPTGKQVLPFQYAYVWALGGGLYGLATGTDGSGSLTGLGIANSKGKVVLAPSASYSEITFKNDTVRVVVRTASSNGWGYDYQDKYFTTSMTASTEAAYEGAPTGPLAQYDWVYPVGNYYLAVKYGASWNGQPAVLNSKYEAVIPLGTYNDINIVTDGASTVFVVEKDEKVGVLDTSLKTMVSFGAYDTIQPHYNGGATLEVISGDKSGVIDFTGKVLVPLGDYGYNAFGGLNADGYITAINKDGSTTLFKDGKAVKTYAGKQVTSEVYYRHLAFTTDGENNGIMDTNEKVILAAQYEAILSDGDNNLLTRNYSNYEYVLGLYTQDGAKILDDKYSEIAYLTDGKYKLSDGAHYGVSKVSGTTVSAVIPMKYVDLRIHTYQFIELYDGSRYSIVDLSNNVVVPETTEEIEVFTSAIKDSPEVWNALDRLTYYGEEYDGYTGSTLPFVIKSGSGYATVYADFQTGKAEGQIPYRASNINDDGWFVYQGSNGWYGFGRTGNGFLDAVPGEWYEEAIDWAVANGIVNGRGNGIFDTGTVCTHQEIILMIWRDAERPIVTSTAPVASAGYEEAVASVNWAYEQGMIDDSFVYNANCTRAQAVEYLWKASGKLTAPTASFTDVPATASYAMAVNWAKEKKITEGVGGGRFGSNDGCSRAHIVTFLYRARNN